MIQSVDFTPQMVQSLDFTTDVFEQDKKQAEKAKEVGRAATVQALDLGAKYRSKITAKNKTDITNKMLLAATNMPDLPSSAQGKGNSKPKGKAKDAPITVAPLAEWMGEVPRDHHSFCKKVPSKTAKDAAEARVHLLRAKDQYQAGLIISDPCDKDKDDCPNIKLIHPCIVASQLGEARQVHLRGSVLLRWGPHLRPVPLQPSPRFCQTGASGEGRQAHTHHGRARQTGSSLRPPWH